MIPQEDYIIKELELSHLSDVEKSQIIESIKSHMEDIVIETTIQNLTPSQLKSAEKELSKDNFDENEIMRITAGIPHLQQKLDDALAAEWNLIKTSYEKIK